MSEQILKKILEAKLVVIARRMPQEKIEPIVEALIDGGVSFLESTFDQLDPNCENANAAIISKIKKTGGDKICVGAGTVLTKEQVRAAYDSGAKYIISPNTNPEVINETKKMRMLSVPGAMTPTEVECAWELGADIVKLFPADCLGYHYIKNLVAPLSHVRLMATGGVNPDSISEFYNAGVSAFGTGITILKPELVQKNDYKAISLLAKQHIEAIMKLNNV